MSFFRKKSGLEIPPVASEPARNELLSSSGGRRSVSPRPPSYRTTNSSVYNASRDGDLSSITSAAQSQDPYARSSGQQGPGGSRLPERYTRDAGGRGAIGDPYARGGNVDADRSALFSGYDPEKRQGGNRFDERGGSGSGRFAGFDDDSGEPRQFQSQQDEDEEVEGIKQQTRFIKQDSVNSTRNALRIAREAEETARNTLLKLGDQSEKLANTERHIDMGKAHALRAEDRTDELKQLNRSIFRPVITWNKDAKRAAAEAKIQARHEEQREEREKAMSDVRETQNRIGRAATYGQSLGDDMGEEGISGRRTLGPEAQRARLEQRKRFQFEKTASDDELEDEIDDNLDALGSATKGLKAIALAAGEELDRQNQRITDIAQKTDKLDVRVVSTTSRLRRIK